MKRASPSFTVEIRRQQKRAAVSASPGFVETKLALSAFDGEPGIGALSIGDAISPAEDFRRLKSQIVLMPADGAATRAIGRSIGCTTGTASKWRARYAKDRLAGFSETGNRGAKAKYGIKTNHRILALLDTAPPDGYANWTWPL